MTRRFGGRFSIVMYHSQAPSGDKVIFLGTQERLLNRDDLGQLDLAVVDEFYKLDPSRQDDRSLTLNAAVYQLLRRSKQFFFLGPNIETVRFSSDSRWRFEFLRTRFSTVAVNTYDLKGLKSIADKEQRLTEEIQNKTNWPALVFVSAPDRANKLAGKLASAGTLHSFSSFSEWIDENFDAGWELSKVVGAGFGVHHGRIPRALASHFVRLFNTGELPVMICTSTLIEGVNTAAKSVLIYDKKINRQDYDFFTFSNIRGRAGRLGQHHVGSVYLFHSPPDQEAVEVEPPLFGDLDEAPDELVVHVSDEHVSPAVTGRIDALAKRLDLTPRELRLASSVGLEDAIALKQFTEAADRHREPIHWSGYPGYKEIEAVCQIICKVRRPNEFGVRSASQLTFFLNDLRSKRTMKEFFRGYSRLYTGEPSAKDGIFRFLRACEYGLPQLFSVVELFAARLRRGTDYTLFTAEMPRWFRPEALKNLDEQGVPVQISERFYWEGDTLATLIARLIEAAQSGNHSLSDFERLWVPDTLPS
ncbi:MAG TPA: helicase-related protein [Stellaceae bacterium]|nr:helicase-related protein [Stellaceae bacterium]